MLRSLRYILLPVLNVTVPIITVFGLLFLIPILVSFYFNDGAHMGFVVAGATCLFSALVVYLISRKYQRELQARDGFLLATLIWLVTPIFASIPLYLEIPNSTITQAFFEAMSGITTTCATVYSQLDTLPQSVNFWRCFLSWLGGMGILVLAVAVLPALGVGGAQIFKAETSGPMKETRLTPRIADTAKGLWWIYVLMSLACVLGYRFMGMNTFDSIVHMFTTISLGGFSSHDASFGYWNNPYIDWTAVVFMILGGMSFSLHFIAWRDRSPIVYFRNIECWAWVLACVFVSILVACILYQKAYYPTFAESLHYAAFNVVSTISTSGFANTDFNLWPAAATSLMFVFACFATSGGSTGGGMKMMRALILFKQMSRQFRLTLQPLSVVPLTINGHRVETSVIFSALGFMLLWIFVAILISLVLMFSGLDPESAFTAVIACMTNLGPGLGQVGPYSNFSVLTDFQLWLCTACMLLGRLELVTVFVLFTRHFWRN